MKKLLVLAVFLSGCASQGVTNFPMPEVISAGAKFTCNVDARTQGGEQKVIATDCVTELFRDHCVKIAAMLNQCVKTSTIEECKQPWMDLCFAPKDAEQE